SLLRAAARDIDPAYLAHPFGLLQIDGQESVAQVRTDHFDSVGKDESALKLPRCDSTVEIFAAPGIVPLPAADREFPFLDGDVENLPRAPRDRDRDPKPFGLAFCRALPLDVVGRIAARRLRGPVERTHDLVEAEQEGRRKGLNTRHR